MATNRSPVRLLAALLLAELFSPPALAATFADPSTQSEASVAGCQWQPIKAGGEPSCVLQQFVGHDLLLSLFDKSDQNHSHPSAQLHISSWYQQAKVSYVDLLGNGTRFIRVESEGNTGTGTLQKLVSLWGWQQRRLVPVLLETSSYQSEGKYSEKLTMTYKLQNAQSKRPALRLHFVYSDNHPSDKVHQQWEENLIWQPDAFSFYDSQRQTSLLQSTANPVYQRIIAARLKLLPLRHHLQRIDADLLNQIGMMQILEHE